MQASSEKIDSTNRFANQSEVEHAANVLRSFGNETLATLVENSIQLGFDAIRPVVVMDFNSVGDNEVLLVPKGRHTLPSNLLKLPRYIIGLELDSEKFPTLTVEGICQPVASLETNSTDDIHVCHSDTKFFGVALDANRLTVMELVFGVVDSQQFSDFFLQTAFSQNIDALNIASNVFCAGQTWALEAYGSDCRRRNVIEEGLDTIHEGGLNIIDSVFRPLLGFGKKLDQLFGLK